MCARAEIKHLINIHNVAIVQKITLPTYSGHAHSPEKQFLGRLWSHDSNAKMSTWECNWTQRVCSTRRTNQSSSIDGCLPTPIFSYRHKIKGVSSCSMNIHHHQVVDTGVSLCSLRMSWSDGGKRRISQQWHLLWERWGTLEAAYQPSRACPWHSCSCVTFFTWMAVRARAVLMASGSISSSILKRQRSILCRRYLATAFGIICTFCHWQHQLAVTQHHRLWQDWIGQTASLFLHLRSQELQGRLDDTSVPEMFSGVAGLLRQISWVPCGSELGLVHPSSHFLILQYSGPT